MQVQHLVISITAISIGTAYIVALSTSVLFPLISTTYNMVVILKISSNIIRKKRKLLYDNDTDIVFEYFQLIKNKDIGRLMNLFSPDAIVYEPFSKLRGGVSGKRLLSLF